MEDKLIIIDGNSLVNRAFYALPPLKNKDGQYLNAIYGFINILIKLLIENQPKYLAIAFDVGKPTFRHLMYSEYKATRHKMPEELASQMPLLQDLLQKMNITIIKRDGIEADDIVGTLSKKFDISCSIITGDKDCFQLINKNCDVWLTRKGISEIDIYNFNNFKEKTTILPNQIIDFKALRGDSSDNIPGAKGIGEKTALLLIEKYENLENIYNHIEEIKGTVKDKLIASNELVKLSYDLASIRTNIDLDIKLEDLKYDFPFSQVVHDLFSKYQFNTLLKRTELCQKFVRNTRQNETNKIYVENEKELKEILKNHVSPNVFAFYYENDIIHFAFDANNEFILQNNLLTGIFFLDETMKLFQDLFNNINIIKIFFEYKNTKRLLSLHNINIEFPYFDIVLANYLIDNTLRLEKIEKLCSQFNFEKDCFAVCLILAYTELFKKLNDDNLYSLYANCELKLENILFEMENYGVKINIETLNNLKNLYNDELQNLTLKIFNLSGCEFNLNSPKQMADVLFNKLNLHCKDNKKLSTNIDVLNIMENDHPIIPLIMRYRKISKLLSTYIDGLLPHLDKDNIVHTEFNQTLVATGRLSSNNPNLQNIPTKDDDGKNIRKMFIPHDPKNVFISADYSQIELRLLAHYSNDEELIKAFNDGMDIHTLTASKIFNIPLEEVTEQERRKAKTINFGIIYGMSSFGLSKSLGISTKEAKQYIDEYFNHYKGAKIYMDESIKKAKSMGYVTTLLGRKRKISEINSSNQILSKFGERAAMNAPLQGTGSDIIKMAMIEIDNELKEKKLKSKLILQIHDELIIEAPVNETEEIKQILKDKMENVVKLKIKLPVNISVGSNWFEV